MPPARATETMSAADYLAAERAAAHKHELVHGTVRAMAGGSIPHGFLTARFTRLLGNALAPTGCDLGSSDIKVRNEAADSYLYPDVVVVCGSPQTLDDRRDVLLNPTAVVEVLSPSTEASDRGEKAAIYRSIPSLHTIIYVSQHKPHIEWLERREQFWTLTEATGIDAVAEFQLLQATVALRDLYDGIELTPAPPIPPRDA